MTKKAEGPVGIYIHISQEAIHEARMAVNDILRADVDQTTKQAALDALTKICRIENVSIADCTVNMKAAAGKALQR